MSRARVAIVGGSGYIGSALATYLSREFDVKVIDILQLPMNLHSKEVEYVRCDIVDHSGLRSALEGMEVVINAAIIQIPRINEQRALGYGVNIIGTQNVCSAVNEIESTMGMIQIGSWHVFGERGLFGTIAEEFGFRPDAVPERARLYALSKIGQEVITRMYGQMSQKKYGVIRVGTVLGERMPEKTAANIFISRGLRGGSITPYKHDMHRPMLYVDVEDVCRFCGKYISRIIQPDQTVLPEVVDLFWPEPITILELAHGIRETIVRLSQGELRPEVEVVDNQLPSIFTEDGKNNMKVDVHRALGLMGSTPLTSPWTVIERIVADRLKSGVFET